jgi:2-dehydro-3-deoxygluconokinase
VAESDLLYDVSTLGEAMLRISVAPGVALDTAESAAIHTAGAENNVVCALAALGHRVAWASRLPDSPPGRRISGELRRAGVDLTHLTWCNGGRVGSFYVELTLPPTPVRVTYDRAGSCATEMRPDSIDWSNLLRTRLLHLTGITPALSADCLATTREAVRRAREQGVPISFDVNFRRKLWLPEIARKTLLPLLQGIELLFIAEADAAEVFGLDGAPEKRIEALRELTQAKRIIVSIGGEGVLAWDGTALRHQPAQVTAMIDRLGAGDALAAGVIHGWLDGDFASGLQAGAALAALCLRRHGDIVLCTRSELQELIQSASSRPQR